MKIGILVGHSILKSGACTSAGGYVLEYAWCKEVAPILANFLKVDGNVVNVIICPERKFTSKNEERTYKLNLINGHGYDLIIELHLNSFDGSAKGTEVLYYPTSKKSKEYAQRVNDKLDDIFFDRDIKARGDLYILRETDCNAILVESFFCDNKEDYLKSDEMHEKKLIAKKIAEGILNKEIKDNDPVKEDIYKIVTGGFGSKEAAENKLSYLKGITGWYLEVKGSDFHIETGGFTGKEKVERKINALKELTGWWMEYIVD